MYYQFISMYITFFCVCAHVCVCTCVRAYTHTHRASQREREMKNKEQQKDNIVEQMPKMPKGLDCSFLISRSQHALVLKHHAVGLV